MNTYFANLDTRQYIALRKFAGNSRPSGVPEAMVYQSWLMGAALLQGLDGRGWKGDTDTVWPGSWRGQRTAIVKGGDRNASDVLPEDLRALRALGAEDGETAYAFVRDNFTDVTEEVRRWLARYTWLGVDQVTPLEAHLTRPSDYSWVTEAELVRLLDRVAWGSRERFQAYCTWLAEQRGLPGDVKALLARCRWGREQGLTRSDGWWHALPDPAPGPTQGAQEGPQTTSAEGASV